MTQISSCSRVALLVQALNVAGPSRVPLLPAHKAAPSCRQLSTSLSLMSGHSRWSKIRHKKGAVDAQRGASFSRLVGDVHNALRPPNSHDPDLNPKLAMALAKAREGGVPKSNIEIAFARAKAAADGTGQSVVYEAVGPGGKVALMIECMTENPARTVQRVKEVLHKNGSRISPVSFLFEKKGLIVLSPVAGSGATFDTLFDVAVDGGAEDVREVNSDEGEGEELGNSVAWEVTSGPSDLGPLTALLTSPQHASSYALVSSELAYLPIDPLVVGVSEEGGVGVGEERAELALRAVDALGEEPDVVKVWTNLES